MTFYEDSDETYATACGETFRSWGAATQHEATCAECGERKYGERDYIDGKLVRVELEEVSDG